MNLVLVATILLHFTPNLIGAGISIYKHHGVHIDYAGRRLGN